MRAWLAAAGLFILAATWLGPLPRWAADTFVAHMSMHMAVVAVAAPLIAAGLAGGRHDPSQKAARAFAPLPASMLELAVVWTWHAPALHHLARSSPGWMALEQGMFLASALLVWIGAIGAAARGAAAAGIGALLMTSMHMTLLGALLSVGPRALFHGHGADALADQQAGGVVMLLIGGLSYMVGGLWLLAAFLRERPGSS